MQISRCDRVVGQTWSWRTDGTLRTLGYCLSTVDHGLREGTWMQLDTCTGTPDQVWNPNVYKSLYNTGSAYCLDVPDGNTTDGTQLRIWTCNGTNAQTWSLTSGAINGHIVSPITDGACLEVGGPNSVGGELVRVGRCTADLTQRWTIGVDGTLRSGGLCLEVTGQTEVSIGAPGRPWVSTPA